MAAFHPMDLSLSTAWRQQFMAVVQGYTFAEPLKEAALKGQRRAWTQAITAASIAACQALGWEATALGHPSGLLPVDRSEYLALDLMAFAPGASRWRFPIAVMELENRDDQDYIAYTLWKLLCVRAGLRVLICYRCYRRQADEGLPLIRFLNEQVIAALTIPQRQALDGETLIGIGSRADAATFPYGYFKWQRLETNTGRFGPF